MLDPKSHKPDVSAQQAVDRLSRATNDAYRLIGPLVGGETGATEIRRSDGTPLVLKWELDPDKQERRREAPPLQSVSAQQRTGGRHASSWWNSAAGT